MKTNRVAAEGAAANKRVFGEGEPVWPLRYDGPLHGHSAWDFTNLVTRTSQADRRIDLSKIRPDYRQDVETILGILAHPDHPNVIKAGIVRRGRSAPTSTVFELAHKLRVITDWGSARSLATFADWTTGDADAFLEGLLDGTHMEGAEGGLGAGTVRGYVTALRLARDFGAALEHPLLFRPWNGRTANEISGSSRALENATPPLGWATWAPLVAGSWAFVDRFSSDIIAAGEAKRELPREPTGPSGWEPFQKWFAEGGVLPLSTGVGQTPQERGAPNKRLLCRRLRVNANFANPAHHSYRPEATRIIAEMAANPNRSEVGGLYTPSILVSHEDGSTSPWISELGLGEYEHLISVLRGACYVIIASLTGMRDGEIQDMQRSTVTETNGLPAIGSVQSKGRSHYLRGQKRTWWAPKPVYRAVEVLSRVSPHPTHLFARSASDAASSTVGGYNPTRDIRRLVRFINDDPSQRPGRGRGLGLESIVPPQDGSINATSLRRSYSVYSVTKPGAELGLGIQLGHSAWRLTSGYASDSKQRAVVQMNDDRRAVLREEAISLITGEAPIAGMPAVDVLNFRAQIVTDPERAARLTEQVADRLHLGLTNDCMFNPSTSGCGADGPHLADHYCIGEDCANALYRPVHLPIIANAIDRIDRVLDNPRGNPDIRESMKRSRTSLSRIERQLMEQEDQI